MSTHADTSWCGWGRKLGGLALLVCSTTWVHGQQYDAGRAAAQRVGGSYYNNQRTATNVQGGYRARAPYQSNNGQPVGRVVYARSMNSSVVAPPRTASYRPAGEVRGNDIVRPVRYQAEVAAQPEMPVPTEMSAGPEMPVHNEMMPSQSVEMMPSQPVEVIDDGGVYYEDSYGGESCSTCSSCSSSDGGICDPAYRSHGCNREKCPCPSDEALSYHRCNHYGHYPTLWRTWPEGFLKYRPEPQDTLYDRFRKAPKGMERSDGGKKDQDLDNQLKDLLKEQEGNKAGRRNPPTPPGERPAPDLLPDDPPIGPDAAPPAPGAKDGSSYRRQSTPSPYAVRPVGWTR